MNQEIENDSVNIQSETIEDEYEEITSDEVDRVVDALDALMETVTSENIRTYLEEASENIYQLIYDEVSEEAEETDEEDEAEPEDIGLIEDDTLNEAA